VHFNIRLEHDRLCCLVLLGVRADGHKELIAVSDGYRESTESWSELLRDLKRRGMRAPVLAVGDGALAFGARCARSSQTAENSAAGCIRSPMRWMRCRPACNPKSKRHYTRS
jgi:transposase-like protein